MEQLKHECGVAMVRLLKPLEYYHQKYGTWMYGLNKLYLLMAFFFIFPVQTLHFPVQTVSHLFEHDIGIGIFARMLSDSCNFFENVVYVCEVEISAKSEVLGSPVVAA